MKVPNLNRSGLESGRASLTLRGLAFSLGLLTSLGVLAAEVGEKAPSFSIVSLTSNETVSLDDFKGKVVILAPFLCGALNSRTIQIQYHSTENNLNIIC